MDEIKKKLIQIKIENKTLNRQIESEADIMDIRRQLQVSIVY